MKKVVTYISGRAISLVLVLGFNILLVKLALPAEYAIYAVLIAGGSIANTVAGLGSQRLVPKLIGMAGRDIPPQRTARLYRVILTARLLLLLACGIGTFVFYQHALDGEISLSGALMAPYVVFAIASSLYLDTESASQTLDQQRLSRLVAVGEPFSRCVALIGFALAGLPITGETMIGLSGATQVIAVLILGINNFRRLGSMSSADASEGAHVNARQLMSLGFSAYLGGIAWMATAAPTLRIVAATFLPPTSLAALSFVQSLGSSFQRYSPGFLLLPFIEPQVMTRQRESRHEVGALLGLVWKVDMIIVFMVLAAISPVAPFILGIISRPEFSPFGFYLGLVLLPIALGTLYRSMEVASVFANVHGAIARASVATFFIFLALYFHGSRLGIVFVLSVPVLDSIVRCLVLTYYTHRAGIGGVVQWGKLALMLAASIAAIASSALATRLDSWQQIGASVAGSIVAAAFLWIVSPLSPAELQLVTSKLPVRFRWIGRVIAGRKGLPASA